MIQSLLTFADNSGANVGETMMPTLNKKIIVEKSQSESRQSRAFDRTVAASVGRCIALRRTLCGLSKEQLGARLGIDAADVAAYEQGTQRISVKLLLETAKHLRAHPTLFFQG
jgi:ribosome-binding protein aMBF1 (putative translation factor)